MTIARPQIVLIAALGFVFFGFSTAPTLAEDKSEHSHAAGEVHAGGHDHDAAKAEKKISEVLATLAAANRKQAVAQRFCPIMLYSRLGSDGTPHKVMIDGTSVFVCCEGCIEDAVAGGKETLAKVMKLTKASAVLAKMPAKDRAAAEAQKFCAIATKNYLGSKVTPIKLELDGNSVFLGCKGCVAKAKADPAATLAKVESLKQAGEDEGHEHGDDGDHDHGGHDHEGSGYKGDGHSDHKH